MKTTDNVILEAIVDQEMGESVNPEIVQPDEFINQPQSHFAKIRLEDNYEVEHNGKYINAGKRIQEDVTEIVLRA